MNIFDADNKLDCTKTNPKYNYALAMMWQLCTDSVYLIGTGNLSEAKLVFSKGIPFLFPKELSNLDMLPSADVFRGAESELFSELYFDLLGLWKDVQRDGISDVSGDNFTLGEEVVLSALKASQNKIESLIS